MHQLMWTRRMVDLLGASGESTARVFGCFFLGLSIGAAVAAWVVPRISRPWRLAGLAEFLVSASALGVFFLPSWSDGLWPTLGPEALAGSMGGIVKLVLSAATVGIPAFFMGIVLPALASAVLEGDADMRREGVWLYALNTLGGALGLLLAAGFLIEQFGAPSTMLAAILLNACIGILCLLADRAASPLAARDSETGQEAQPLGLLFCSLAFLSGLGVLAAEVTANQMVMLVATLSFYAPATILFCVILLLALGAFAAAPFMRVTRNLTDTTRLSCLLAVAGVTFAMTPIGFMSMAKRAGFLKVNDSVLEFAMELGGIVLLTIGPAFFIAGLLFPLLLSRISSVGRSAASQLAVLLALNGVGGFLGAEFAYRFLLPAAGPFGATTLVGVGYAGAAFALALLLNHTRLALGTLVALVFAVWLVNPVVRLPMVNPHLGFRTLAEWAGREGTVTVVETESGHRSLLMSNQYILGGTSARASQERQAWLPLLLHPSPEDVAFIGLATGTTPGAALADSRVERITAIEISPLVNTAAEKFFGDVNRNITNDPRATVVIEDGRTYLAACVGRFDVIAGDLFLPWGPGEARLFSVEHFRGVRRALEEDGIFYQWLPLYQLTPWQLETIAATFQKVFPRTYVFASPAADPMPVLALVGFEGHHSIDIQNVHQHSQELAAANGAHDLEAWYLGEWRPMESADINTLGNLSIELDAGRERLTDRPGAKYLQGRRWSKYRAELSGSN